MIRTSYSRAMPPVPSLDPSSTTMTSKSGHHRHSRVGVQCHCSQRVQESGTLNASSVPDLRMYRSVLNLQCGQVEHLLLRTDEVQLHPCRELLEGGGHRRVHPVKDHTDSQGCSLSLVLLAVVAILLQPNILSFLLRGNGVITVIQLGYSNWVIPPSFFHSAIPSTNDDCGAPS